MDFFSHTPGEGSETKADFWSARSSSLSMADTESLNSFGFNSDKTLWFKEDPLVRGIFLIMWGGMPSNAKAMLVAGNVVCDREFRH